VSLAPTSGTYATSPPSSGSVTGEYKRAEVKTVSNNSSNNSTPSTATTSTSPTRVTSPTMATSPPSSSTTMNTNAHVSGDGFGPWQCPSCTYDNPRRSLRCDSCSQANPFLPKPSSISTSSNTSATSSGTSVDSPSHVNGGDINGGMLPADTAWTCDACTYRNARRGPLCTACHTPNPNADESDFGAVPMGDFEADGTARSSTASVSGTVGTAQPGTISCLYTSSNQYMVCDIFLLIWMAWHGMAWYGWVLKLVVVY
jgi:hypothetical protein